LDEEALLHMLLHMPCAALHTHEMVSVTAEGLGGPQQARQTKRPRPTKCPPPHEMPSHLAAGR
jgi:hypothetical protein